MEVQTCAGIAKVIMQTELEMVAHGGRDEREWPCAVDANRRSVEAAVGIGGDPSDGEVVLDGLGLDEGAEDEQQRRRDVYKGEPGHA